MEIKLPHTYHVILQPGTSLENVIVEANHTVIASTLVIFMLDQTAVAQFCIENIVGWFRVKEEELVN